ncbi:MAG: hypothetical protein K0M49_15005 [Arenimonas sp.]|nr:hypothetical protein [Rhizobium sp.]MBW8446927.1 hypothetical protein [Arenimonas sp.]
MTLDTVAKFSAAYILTVIVSASGYTLWEGLHPRTVGAIDPSAELLVADR